MIGALRERFDAKWMPEPNSGCWLWTASVDKDGYGAFGGVNGYRFIRAHRAAWIIYRGEDPNKKSVLHRCDVPSCVNPNHLFLGDAVDNVQDRDLKGRTCRGSKRPASKLVEDDISDIRLLAAHGMTQTEIAGIYGVSQAAIGYVLTGTTWKHVQ